MTPSQAVHLDATGLALHALERNRAGNPAVLFLHGWLDHCHGFDWVCDALPPTWRMLALDFRGHGQSAHLTQGLYHFTDYLADVEAAVDSLGGPVHLVGHSMGGAVAFLYASARPERVRSLTALENLGPLGGAAEDIVPRLGRFIHDFNRPTRKRVYPSVADAIARVRENNSSLSAAAAEWMTRHGTRPVDGGFEFTFDAALHRKSAFVFDEAQILTALGAVRCPVQVIHGTRGYTLDDAQMKTRLDKLGSPRPIPVEGGHHVHLDRPVEVASHLRTFIEAAR